MARVRSMIARCYRYHCQGSRGQQQKSYTGTADERAHDKQYSADPQERQPGTTAQAAMEIGGDGNAGQARGHEAEKGHGTGVQAQGYHAGVRETFITRARIRATGAVGWPKDGEGQHGRAKEAGQRSAYNLGAAANH